LHLAASAPPLRQADDSSASPSSVEVVFRVRAGSYLVPRYMSIVGPHDALGALRPNMVLMHGDGASGDERAGDGVWSSAAAFPEGTHLLYVYTNSGAPGEWEGVDVPAIRRLTVRRGSGGRMYAPIETFGKIYMQADNWHTDARGYDLIAGAVADAIV